MFGRHTIIKITLILVAEAIAMILTNLVSEHIIYIPHTTATYLICGAVLAYFVVVVYNRVIETRRKRIEKELKAITDVALMNYNVHDNKQ